ncbi:hypothetical protein CC79DRAFT_1354803 [Sarocladium strictum]
MHLQCKLPQPLSLLFKNTGSGDCSQSLQMTLRILQATCPLRKLGVEMIIFHRRLGDAASRPWPATISLSKHIKATICDDISDPTDVNPQRLFSRRFTLFDMDWLCLIKIKWTNNIAQHLYLEEWKDRSFNRTVYVFSHTALMESLVQDTRQEEGIKEFLNETMDTLDLLMDLQDPEAGQWYRKLRKKAKKQRAKLQLPNNTEAMDMFAGFPRRTNSLLNSDVSELRKVGHYKHWQPRLLRLEKAFEETVAALVVAFVAVLFTLASVVTAPMSVILANKANSLANDGKGLAQEANDLAREDLLGDPGGPASPNVTTTTETQTIVVVVHEGCCDCANCQAGDTTGSEVEENLVTTLTTDQVVGATTCAT